MNKHVSKPIVRKLRCAVYTRKSSEEGLDMEFNSLDAQREACEAYVASQRSEGWVLVPELSVYVGLFPYSFSAWCRLTPQ